MTLRDITYVKYMSRKEAAKNNQLLFSFLSYYRFSDFFTANTSEVACDINGF